MEELEAPCKNKTWVLNPLQTGKKAVSCKWVYIVKHNEKENIERYKARFVAGGTVRPSALTMTTNLPY